jgi:hypothetical protein
VWRCLIPREQPCGTSITSTPVWRPWLRPILSVRSSAPVGTATGCLLLDADVPQILRVAGIIVLLYAQPLTRVVRLTVDDVLRDGGAVFLRLGDPPSPVPEPVASLLLDYIAARDNMNTATNRASHWLFPGRRAGQPCRPDHLSALLREIGIPAAAARGAAIRQQLLEMPAPSSSTPSATTTRPPPASFGKAAEPGTATPPGNTRRHHQAPQERQLATVE